ncbi:MAG: DEAD/DEAH box helicase [Candidatus Brocadia sp.]|nr:DEAD/DEAH box helicase [Candidatus Brocadia sp.]
MLVILCRLFKNRKSFLFSLTSVVYNLYMIVDELSAYGGSKRLIETLTVTGLKELYPPQVLAIKAGLLKKQDSFVVAAPTASGKTLIAEMAALKVFLEMGGKVVYLVPLRALAREKYDDFSKKYKDAGMRVVQSTGDFDSADTWLYDADLIISTNEKMDSLIRHRSSWLRDVSLVVTDEIHLLGDTHRGPTLEVVLTRLKWMNPGLRVIALSATIPNASEIAQWLDAQLIESNWRPVPLREGVYFNNAITFQDGGVSKVKKEGSLDVVNLGLETINDGGQSLVFVNTRRSTEAVAHMVLSDVAKLLSEQEIQSLKKLSGQVLEASSEPTHLCKKLAECVSNGVAFHHAGIISSQRKIVEDAFRANKIKLVAATTTLAMGLNLPSRRVIIRDWWRYESGLGMQPIPVMEIKQMSGRAGRPGFDKYGEAVVIARNERDKKYLMESYIGGEPEKIDSQLASESALRSHILASIAGVFTRSRAELMDFLKKTFFAYQEGTESLASVTNTVVNFLKKEEMISDKRGLVATRFGRRVSDLYIDPLTGVIVRDALHQPKEKETFALFHMIAHTPDMMTLQLRKKDYEEMYDVYHAHVDGLLIPKDEKYPSDEILSEIKTALLLMQWMEETPEDKVVGQFGVGPGDIRTLIELSDWLLYSAGEISKVFGLKEVEKPLSFLRVRVFYGIKEELLQLVSLKGVGRVRARNLYNAGYKTLKDIKGAAVEDLVKIPTIGKAIAEDIKNQVLSQ